eukprot:3264051-Amphidinium_carterae.2
MTPKRKLVSQAGCLLLPSSKRTSSQDPVNNIVYKQLLICTHPEDPGKQAKSFALGFTGFGGYHAMRAFTILNVNA